MTLDQFIAPLVGARLIDSAAVEDPDNYDDGEMMERVKAAYLRLQRTEAGGWVIALKRAYRRMDVHQVKSLCNTVSIGILLADTPNTERKAA